MHCLPVSMLPEHALFTCEHVYLCACSVHLWACFVTCEHVYLWACLPVSMPSLTMHSPASRAASQGSSRPSGGMTRQSPGTSSSELTHTSDTTTTGHTTVTNSSLHTNTNKLCVLAYIRGWCVTVYHHNFDERESHYIKINQNIAHCMNIFVLCCFRHLGCHLSPKQNWTEGYWS